MLYLLLLLPLGFSSYPHADLCLANSSYYLETADVRRYFNPVLKFSSGRTNQHTHFDSVVSLRGEHQNHQTPPTPRQIPDVEIDLSHIDRKLCTNRISAVALFAIVSRTC